MQTRSTDTELPVTGGMQAEAEGLQKAPGVSFGPELRTFQGPAPTLSLAVTWEPRQLTRHRCRRQEGGNFSLHVGGMALSLAHPVPGRQAEHTHAAAVLKPRRTGRFKGTTTEPSAHSIAARTKAAFNLKQDL